MHHGWNVEVTEEFTEWWHSLPGKAHEMIAHDVEVLRKVGPSLGRPWVDAVKGSRHANMKELRTAFGRSEFRILFAFDPRRTAILIVGGDKAGERRFYRRMVREADGIYDRHLKELETKGNPS